MEFLFRRKQKEFQEDVSAFPHQTSPSGGIFTLVAFKAMALKYEAIAAMLCSCLPKDLHTSIGSESRDSMRLATALVRNFHRE